MNRQGETADLLNISHCPLSAPEQRDKRIDDLFLPRNAGIEDAVAGEKIVRRFLKVFPDLSRASTIEITPSELNLRYYDYPKWDPAKTYAKGEIVVFQTGNEPYRTIVSDFDDNLGCHPAYGWGWSTLMPHVVDHSGEIEYKTIEEWEAAE